MSRVRLLSWGLLALVVVGALTVGLSDDGEPRSLSERARDIAASVKCPTCRSQSAADSDAPAARGVRAYIEERLQAGASDDQIRAELADAHGEAILLTPARSGLTGMVWALPVVVLVLSFAGLTAVFLRWRRRRPTGASDGDRAVVEAALREGTWRG